MRDAVEGVTTRAQALAVFRQRIRITPRLAVAPIVQFWGRWDGDKLSEEKQAGMGERYAAAARSCSPESSEENFRAAFLRGLAEGDDLDRAACESWLVAL